MNNTISFTGAKQLESLQRTIKRNVNTRFYDDIKHGVFDGLTKDEFQSVSPLVEEMKGKSIFPSQKEDWNTIMDTLKTRLGF